MSVSLFAGTVPSPPGEQPPGFHPLGTFPLLLSETAFLGLGAANATIFVALVLHEIDACSLGASWQCVCVVGGGGLLAWILPFKESQFTPCPRSLLGRLVLRPRPWPGCYRPFSRGLLEPVPVPEALNLRITFGCFWFWDSFMWPVPYLPAAAAPSLPLLALPVSSSSITLRKTLGNF